MVLQNRALPDGTLASQNWRGTFMGNRGGRIHNPQTQTLLKRKWASKRWICCVTRFKGRQRTVMGDGYTELFFLDEVSALACGHRPCFECRRSDARRFADHWANSSGMSLAPTADEMDKLLHSQRTGEKPLLQNQEIQALPDGVMLQDGENFLAKYQGLPVRWSGKGYRPTGPSLPDKARLLTPLCVVSVLADGYQPEWHATMKG